MRLLWLFFPYWLFAQSYQIQIEPYLGHYGASVGLVHAIRPHFQATHALGGFAAPEYEGIHIAFLERISLRYPAKFVNAHARLQLGISSALSKALQQQGVKQWAIESIPEVGFGRQLSPKTGVEIGLMWKGIGRITKTNTDLFGNWNGDNFGTVFSITHATSSKRKMAFEVQLWQKGRLKQAFCLRIDLRTS